MEEVDVGKLHVGNLKLEDLYIIEEKPLRVKVGERYLLIKPLPLRQVDKFEMQLADLLLKWSKYLEDIQILDYSGLHTLPRIEAFSTAWKRLLKKDKKFLRDVCKLICKPYKFSVRYFMKHATYDTVTQCFLATQLLNYDAVKKNIQFLLTKAHIIQQSPALLATLRGSSGGVKKKRLTPRY
ncbi:MAG: hypothetical protein ACTSPB_25305 [Candidatus Thorarchaeota archaeon]